MKAAIIMGSLKKGRYRLQKNGITERSIAMTETIFDLGLPDDVIDILIEKAGGKRLRIPCGSIRSDRRSRERRNDAIKAALIDGVSAEELAEKFDLSVTHIMKIACIRDVSTRHRTSELRLETIKRLLNSGLRRIDIAKKLGISRQRLYQILKKEGISI